jgi:hypothetical protein
VPGNHDPTAEPISVTISKLGMQPATIGIYTSSRQSFDNNSPPRTDRVILRPQILYPILLTQHRLRNAVSKTLRIPTQRYPTLPNTQYPIPNITHTFTYAQLTKVTQCSAVQYAALTDNWQRTHPAPTLDDASTAKRPVHSLGTRGKHRSPSPVCTSYPRHASTSRSNASSHSACFNQVTI